MTQSYLGDNLYALRKAKGISQDEFAEHLGVSRQAVSKWERNEAYPDTENLIAISKFYGVTIDDLINKSLNASDSVNDTENKESSQIIVDDNDNDDDDDDDGDAEPDDSKPGNLLINLPYPVLITLVYLLLGFTTPRGWEIGWTLYVTIPVFYSVLQCIRRKRLSCFAYPVFITFVFLLLGMLYGIWHPLWIIYITIPIYYPIAEAIDKTIRNKHE